MGNKDILLVLETKTDDSFPICHGIGLMLISFQSTYDGRKTKRNFLYRIKIFNSKWLINCSDNPHKKTT